jgi:polyhydroxybutyrate depolymerase
MEISVLGLNRTYYLRVPGGYDPNHAYPLIFRWHGSGGNGLSGGLGIEGSSGNDAIVVGADGLNREWNSKADSPDLVFFDRMLEMIEKRYCIDRDRVFSYGFSSGASFANLLACERGDVLRASAAIAGRPRGSNCKGKVASWFLSDADDHIEPIAEGEAARDRALAANGCSTNTVDEGGGCVRYQGCDAAPVVWCESKGFGHNIRGDFAPARVWKFFMNLR